MMTPSTSRGSSRQRYRQAVTRESQYGDRASDAYLDGITSFDPYAAVERSTQGAYNSIRDQLGKDLGDYRQTQTGLGRLNSGWAQEGEDELYTGALDRLNNSVMQYSTQAAGQDLSRLNSLGQFGTQGRMNYYDLLSGQLDREQASQNARRGRTSGLLGGLGALAGGLFAGAPGAAVGSAVGSGIGGWF